MKSDLTSSAFRYNLTSRLIDAVRNMESISLATSEEVIGFHSIMNIYISRELSSICNHVFLAKRALQYLSRSMSSFKSLDLNTEKEEFIKAFPTVVDNLTKHPKFQELPAASQWMRKVLNGNCLGGKNSRGLVTVLAYRMTETPVNINEYSLHLARTLGWCTEMFQAYGIILDDIADDSTTRRGRPCWHLQEGNTLALATNDSTLVNCCMMKTLKDNFADSPYYVDMFHTINEALLVTSIGQYLDIQSGQAKNKYDLFTITNYNAIVNHKTAYYTYKMPITLGLLLAKKLGDETKKNVNDISAMLGRLFQMQDDYIDCFGDVSMTGKVGTDIQEGKCSWLAVNALQLSTPKIQKVFKSCYGSREPAHVERIKQLYIQLKLPDIYKQEEMEIFNHIVNRIKAVSAESERELFSKLLDITYRREY